VVDERSVSVVHQIPQYSPLTVPPTPPKPITPSPVSQDHMKRYGADGSRHEGASSRNRGDLNRDNIGVSSSDEEMRMQLEGLEVDIESAQCSSARKNAPVSVSYTLWYYHIVGNFHGIQFSRMASLQSFPYLIFTNVCDHAHYTCTLYKSNFCR
jgi:hypothetical protein